MWKMAREGLPEKMVIKMVSRVCSAEGYGQSVCLLETSFLYLGSLRPVPIPTVISNHCHLHKITVRNVLCNKV